MSSSTPLRSEGNFVNYSEPYFLGSGLFDTSISRYMDCTLVLDGKASETRGRTILKTMLKGTSILACLSAGFPLIELNMEFGEEHPVYGGTLAFATSTSMCCLVSYSVIQLLRIHLDRPTNEEEALSEYHQSRIFPKVLFISSAILGFGTQVPLAYALEKHQNPSPLDPGGRMFPLVLFMVDSWISVFSAFCGIKALKEARYHYHYERHLIKARDELIQLVNSKIQYLEETSREKKLDEARHFQSLRQIPNSQLRAFDFFSLATLRVSDWSYKQLDCSKYEELIKAFGYFFAFCNVGALGYVTWLGSNELTENKYASGTITGLYALTIMHLNMTAIPETTLTLFNLFKNILTCSYQPSIVDQLSPKLSFCLKTLSLLSAGLSYGPAGTIAKEYFGYNKGLEIIAAVTLSSAMMLLFSMATLSISNRLLETKIEKMGSEEERLILSLHKKLKLFASTIASCPLVEFASFLRTLPPEDLKKLIEKTEIDGSNIDRYIDDVRAAK